VSDLDSALWNRMVEIALTEKRSFSFVDFVPTFEEDGQMHPISHGTLRNKISAMLRAKKLRVLYHSPQAFYTINGKEFEGPMTEYPIGVRPFPQRARLANDPVYRVIQNLPFGKRGLHDIHLRFEVEQIWATLSSKYKVNPCSKDIQLMPPWPWKIKDLDLMVTVHSTDTVSVVVSCSYSTVAVDIAGVVRLSNALSVVQERLNNILCSSTSNANTIPAISDCLDWVVTLWHFGTDSLITFSGDKFNVSWEIAEHALITAYSKEWKNGKTRVRIEKQEYPRKSLAEALEEKLNGYRTNEGAL
jgi:hypothetical protein